MVINLKRVIKVIQVHQEENFLGICFFWHELIWPSNSTPNFLIFSKEKRITLIFNKMDVLGSLFYILIQCRMIPYFQKKLALSRDKLSDKSNHFNFFFFVLFFFFFFFLFVVVNIELSHFFNRYCFRNSWLFYIELGHESNPSPIKCKVFFFVNTCYGNRLFYIELECESDILPIIYRYIYIYINQQEHTFSNYVRIRDVVQKTFMRWWTIGKSGERGSGISVLPARHDDDDIYNFFFFFFFLL